MNFHKKIYIAHPYGGLKENEEKVADIILELIKKNPNILFVSPIHSFSFAYNSLDYDNGLRYCFGLLELCDEVWVFGDYINSTGCLKEIEYCRNNGKKYLILGDKK